jgi:hypothetical protein
MISTTRIIDAPMLSRRVADLSLHIDYKTISGGVAINGGEQILASPTPIWNAAIEVIAVENEARAWLAFVDSLRGRSGAARLRLPRHWLDDLYERLGASANAGTTYSDGATHSDGSTFAPIAPVFRLLAPAAFWATELNLDMTGYEKALRAGDLIGCNGNLYRIESAWAASGTSMRVAINPPLRKTASLATQVTTDPTIVMRVEADREGWVSRTVEPIVRPTIKLIELPHLA